MIGPPTERRLVPDPAQQAAIQRMHALSTEGKSTQQIAATLNAEGIPSPPRWGLVSNDRQAGIRQRSTEDTMTDHNERTAIYTRSATNNPESIDNQRDALRAHAAAHGYEVVEEYDDNGVSVRRNPFERAGLGALLNDPAEWDTLLVWDPARVSRDFNGINQLEDWLEEHGKTMETVDGLRFPHLGADCP